MTLKKSIILLSIFIAMSANAQPGGGGGLRIMNVLDYNANPISKNDTSLKVKHYVLSNKTYKVKNEYFINESDKNSHQYTGNSQAYIYLPDYILRKKKKINVSNQRLILIYKNDTMTIDLIDILAENASGHTAQMDKIQFQSGYFKCYLKPQKSHLAMWKAINLTENQKNEALHLLEIGIDNTTLFRLKNIGLIEHVPNPNLQNKRLQRERENCKEFLVGKYYHNLCYDMIQVDDRDSTIDISTKLLPITFDSTNYFHFHYFFQFSYWRNLFNNETELARTVLKKLIVYQIKINGSPFSGKIKYAVLYHDVGISSNYSIYVIYINKYYDGKILNTNILRDVDLDTEEPMTRPN